MDLLTTVWDLNRVPTVVAGCRFPFVDGVLFETGTRLQYEHCRIAGPFIATLSEVLDV